MNIILEAEGKLFKNCTRNHVVYCFQLDESVEKLNINFCYEPKLVTDKEEIKEIFEYYSADYPENDKKLLLEEKENIKSLSNFLTISIDDEKGFRGCGHRHNPNQKLFISKEKASEGFIPGEIKKGMWKVTISTHAILSEAVNYKLIIREGDGEDESMESM